jgi:hypothetical protein
MTAISSLNTTDTKTLPVAWVERIFKLMTMYHGNRFADQFDGMNLGEVKQFWSEQLAEFTPDELKNGLYAAERTKWPPTLAEFKSMCRPELQYEVLYAEAARGIYARRMGSNFDWSHPAVFFAACDMAHEIMNDTYKANRTRWEACLDKAMSMHRQSPLSVPEPFLSLPEPVKNLDVGRKAMEGMRDVLAKMKRGA